MQCGLKVERKNPAEFFRTEMASNFVESLNKFEPDLNVESRLAFTVTKGGKNPSDFLRTDMAKNFIGSLEKMKDTDTGNPVTPYTSVKGGKCQGTYAVRLLAQRYCGWLSSDFEVAATTS